MSQTTRLHVAIMPLTLHRCFPNRVREGCEYVGQVLSVQFRSIEKWPSVMLPKSPQRLLVFNRRFSHATSEHSDRETGIWPTCTHVLFVCTFLSSQNPCLPTRTLKVPPIGLPLAVRIAVPANRLLFPRTMWLCLMCCGATSTAGNRSQHGPKWSNFSKFASRSFQCEETSELYCAINDKK